MTISKGIWCSPVRLFAVAFDGTPGTSGCLATSSLSPRPGTDTWCPVGRGLRHLRQLSVKAHTEAVSRSFIPNTAFHSGFPPPKILYSLLDPSPAVRRSHQYGKPWMVLSLLHHCSHSACFRVCTISRQTVPPLVFDVPGTGKLLFIQLEWKRDLERTNMERKAREAISTDPLERI